MGVLTGARSVALEEGRRQRPALYRCALRRGRALTDDFPDHPRALYGREAAILAPLDAWIVTITSPEALAAHHPSSPHASANDALKARLTEVDRKISALITAVEAWADLPQLSEQLRRRAAERDGLEAQLRALPRKRALSPYEMGEAIARIGGIASILANADAAARCGVYQSLGTRLDYDHANRRVTASAVEACT